MRENNNHKEQHGELHERRILMVEERSVTITVSRGGTQVLPARVRWFVGRWMRDKEEE